ncbi:MAG: FtsX-like permease family protein [Gemmatimonadales bacterium]
MAALVRWPPEALGRRLELHATGVSYTIVGVMPQGLDFPRGTDLWSPLNPGTARRGDSAFANVELLGRLRPGLTPAAARDELTGFFRRPGTSTWEQSLRGRHPARATGTGDVAPAVIVFSAAAGLLLLITCANVANLLFVRGLSRVREVAIRSALGARRGRVVRQLLAENALLAVAGGTLGVVVAAGAIRALVAVAPAGLPRLSEIGVDGAALGVAVLVTALTLLLAGLAPAVVTSRADLQQVLRTDVRQSPTRRSRLAADGVVVGQFALAVVVLAAAGLIGRSLLELERAELAFDAGELLIGELTMRVDRFDSQPKQLALLDRVVDAVAGVPGVVAASPVVAVPFAGTGGWDGRPTAIGQTEEAASRHPLLNMEVVTPGYFPTLGLAVSRGRSFTDADREDAPAVVMVSESAARSYWPGEDAIGKRLTMGGSGPMDTATVVGIVPDTRYRDLRVARPSIYFPLRQSIFPFAPTSLVIRTAGRPGALAPAIRRAIETVDPAVAVLTTASFDHFLARPLAQPRFNALLVAVFAGASIVLAGVGLFGVMAATVRERARELGVRMALGATGGALAGMLFRRGLAIAVIGSAIGLVGAPMGNRLLTALLYRVSADDGVTLAVVGALALGIGALAMLVPIRAATRIDPVRALHVE